MSSDELPDATGPASEGLRGPELAQLLVAMGDLLVAEGAMVAQEVVALAAEALADPQAGKVAVRANEVMALVRRPSATRPHPESLAAWQQLATPCPPSPGP